MAQDSTLERAKNFKTRWEIARYIGQVIFMVIAGIWAVKGKLQSIESEMSSMQTKLIDIEEKNTKLWDEHWVNNIRLDFLERQEEKRND